MSAECGLRIAADSPFSSAHAKNVALTASRAGSPNETLEIPRDVWQPSSLAMRRTASSVTSAAPGSALTVMASGSKSRSSGPSPYAVAARKIFSAMRTRPSAVAGMPSSSSVSATTSAPYFRASGNTLCRLSRLPLTELSSALPL